MKQLEDRGLAPVATLRFWRHTGEYGPPSAKIGRRVLYREADVERWIAAQFDAPKPGIGTESDLDRDRDRDRIGIRDGNRDGTETDRPAA
jgi:hypothetical protein